MNRFQDKTAFVTGAASGIGLATATLFAREGARVYASDINAEALHREAERLRKEDLQVVDRELDVTVEQACRDAISDCVAQFGGLDILVNVAGVALTCHFTDLTYETWRRMMAVNLDSVFVLCHAAIPHLLESKGNIVNISSTAGVVGQLYNTAYCASKGGVVLLSKALATEYAGRGVRVNAVCPGAVNTPIIRGLRVPEEVDLSLYSRLSPLTPYFAEPEEIAAAVAYLASPEARYVTGSALVIDGGQTAI